ncbi:hypothetical protein ABID56_002509 [Alkalibacillus flavidus]|uniref:Uncharacterized protein n=1 Tax=Alkalibacillus flavidus TaxID=546021 RepID=A0ABV2KXR5_9BACI
MSESQPKRRSHIEKWIDILLFIPELIVIPLKYMARGIMWLVRVWLY